MPSETNRAPMPVCSPPCTLVFFVEPDPSNLDAIRRIASRMMLVPPRINETVTIQPAFGARPARYTVHEVIHHIPPVAAAGIDSVVNECTCVIIRPVGPAEVAGVVDALCREVARDLVVPPPIGPVRVRLLPDAP